MGYKVLLLSLVLAALTILSGCAANSPAAPTAPAKTNNSSTAKTNNSSAAPTTAASTTLTDLVPYRKDTVQGASTPKRGGTITAALAADWQNWDPTLHPAITVAHMPYSSSKLIQGDWTKGPQGTGQTTWEWGYLSDVSLLSGELAESWETPDPTTIIYHLRKDAHFQNIAPANGREVTADDVVWNIIMQFNYPSAWQTMAYPPAGKPASVTDHILPGPLRPTSVKALDKYTVEVKVPAESQGMMLLEMGCNMYTSPPEVWANGGSMSDWHKVVGSSAWIISNYVSGSEITLSRNPNYWEKDPLHPDQKLPYLDGLKLLVIPDPSTRLTALRTGKVDYLSSLSYDDAKTLTSAIPKLQWSNRVGTQYVASGREDKPNLPFHDIRVRQAMNLAVDKQAILKNYMHGAGALLGYPYPPTNAYAKYFTPLAQMPSDVQMLFTGYDPTKAKQLLAEAGYPNGFKTTIQGPNTPAATDEMSMLKDYLGKVGIDMQIQPLDIGTYNQLNVKNDAPGMWYGGALGIWAPDEMLMTKAGMYSNKGKMNDPYYVNVQKIVAADMVANPDTYFKTMKAAGVHELQSAWAIWMPIPYQYNVWWPWMQNYDGINWTGWAGAWQWMKYVWIDQNMKKAYGF